LIVVVVEDAVEDVAVAVVADVDVCDGVVYVLVVVMHVLHKPLQ